MKLRLNYLIILILFCVGCKNNSSTPTDISQRPIKGCAPITTDFAWYESDNIAPIIDGLDVWNFPVTTDNPLVQKYVNQGLVLAYGFNHAEAARSFYYASKLDPECAMAFWGFAYVLGPNYNGGMEPDNYERAHTAIQKAQQLIDKVSPKEKALINALSKRYTKEVVDDRSSYDVAYKDAMKELYIKFPSDADIASMYAESIMDLHPWDLWDKKGNMLKWTPEIISVLKNVIENHPNHPGAHHFYIHAVETSFHPEDAMKSAELFDEGLVPGAGHLIHMPSHIYIRTGDYHKGTLSNIRAVEVDSAYSVACNAQGAYPLAYFPHNYHFMAATATLEGNSKWAFEGALKVAEHASVELMKEPGWGTIQHYYTTPYNVYVKFGKWKEILAMTNEDSSIKYPEAVRHYARGMAFLGLKDLENAKLELELLTPYLTDKDLSEITIWDINSVDVLLEIAQKVLKAEILATEMKYDESISLLREAVVIEDALNYNEPPDWFFSVRHHLGAVLIEAGRFDESLMTYEEDLKRLPKNGWALHGLKLAYEKMNDREKVQELEIQLRTVWATADINLSSSRIK